MTKSDFKFIKKNNKFICENDKFKIEFMYPYIEGVYDDSSILGVKDIKDFYYTIKLYRSEKKNVNGEVIKKWKLVSEKQVEENFQVIQFQDMLNKILDKDTQNCQKVLVSEKQVEQSYVLGNSNFVQDYYELQKVFTPEKNVYFNLYIGLAMDEFADTTTVGIKLQKLDYHDILVMKKCVDEFIQYSMEKQTLTNKIYNKRQCSSFFIKDNVLFQYAIENNKVNEDKYDNVFGLKEETLDVSEVVFADKNEFKSVEHENVMITEISKKGIKLSDETFIKKNKILAVYRYLENDDERLQYGVNGVSNNMLMILNPEDREEFKRETTEFLVNKWGNVIANRVGLYVPEHNLTENKETLTKIVNKIKEKLG